MVEKPVSISTKRVKHAAAAFVLALAMFVMVSGCSRSEGNTNLVTNGSLTAWNDETNLPIGWKVEGEGLSVNAVPAGLGGSTVDFDMVEARFTNDVFFISSPFFFSTIRDSQELAGKTVRFSVWVNTDMSDTVFLEVSDRAGNDLRSKPHPGSGNWQRLTTEFRVPPGTKLLEFRVRFNRPAVALVKEPYASTGYF